MRIFSQIRAAFYYHRAAAIERLFISARAEIIITDVIHSLSNDYAFVPHGALPAWLADHLQQTRPTLH